MISPRFRVVLVGLGLGFAPACGDGDDPMTAWVPNTGSPAPVAGMAFIFGPNGTGLSLAGATVAVAEQPDVATTVAADGSFRFEVPSGGPVSFSLLQPGFHPNQSATIEVDAAGIPMLGFQAPTEDAFDFLGALSDITPDPTRCQIATTVSRAGTTPFGGDALGAADAVVTIDPPPPAGSSAGPIYFGYSDGVIFPDPALTATSIDGGVIFANVPVGEYTLTATKPGSVFARVNIRCRAGVLVNAAPPNDLREQ